MRGRARAIPALTALAVLALTACTGSVNAPGSAPTPDSGPASASVSPGAAPSDADPSVSGAAVPEAPALEPEATGGPTAGDVEAASGLVAAMTVEQQAGQVIVARIPGTTAAAGAELVRTFGLGGVILFDENVVWPQQVAELTAGLQQAAEDAGRAYPLIIGVDQEGGTVARVRTGLTEMPTFMTFGAAGDPAIATAAARASGAELQALGVTMVFAPTADVTSGPDDPTIGTRSASDRPDVVADMVNASVRGFLQAGVVPVVKHFPGHGSVPADSHEELPVQRADLDELLERDLVPFREAAAAGVPAVMVGHIDVRDVDPWVPSSLSAPDVAVLRDQLGFAGLVVTDALEMDAVVEGYGTGEAAVRALLAGADLLLMPLEVVVARDAIVEAVQDATLPPARLADAATAVVSTALWQQRLGGSPGDRSVLGSPDHHAASYAASLAGLTVVDGPCEGALVEAEIQVDGGTDEDRLRLASAAAARGLTVGDTGPVVQLAEDSGTESGDVVVALDRPYGLGWSDASIAKIALYGRTPDAFAALVDVLLGLAQGRGQLPVVVEGVERDGCP